MDIPDRIRAKLGDLPDAPGVYLMRDAAGRVIYVGKASSLRRRVRSYFFAAALRRADGRLRSLVRSIADLDAVPVRTEAEAAVLEGQWIKEYRPRFNVAFKDDKRFLLLRLDLREPWPRLTLARLRRDDGALWFGPYPSAAVARTTAEFLDRHFGLRRCRPREPGPEDHRHCHNDILRYCSAPCVGRISAEEYRRRAERAAAFLRGEDPELLRLLRDAMKQAASTLEFERAAALRDLLDALQRAIRERALGRRPPAARATAAAEGLAALAAALGLSTPPRRIEAYDISNLGGTLAVGSMVVAVDGLPQRRLYRRFRIRTVGGSDDPAMMAEVLRRRWGRAGAAGWEPPGLLVVDGGLTQLRAARAALREAGRPDVPSVGLAKRFEELYGGPDGAERVLSLAPDSPALTVLKMLRDEAHRFALDYHRRLRSRRISESRLDVIEGVGPAKKAALLRRFGSVARLARAAEAEIAAVPGIGPVLARRIAAELAPPAGPVSGG